MVEIRMMKYKALTFLGLALLSGCARGDFESPALDAAPPADWSAKSGALLTAAGAYEDTNWSAAFNDLKLSSLITEALAHNHDLQVTAANLDKAGAQARKAGADLAPFIGLSANAGRSGNMESRDSAASQYGVSLDISWEADVWGRIRSGKNAAIYDYYAAQNDYDAARQSLAAQTAKAWFLAIETEIQTDLAAAFEGNLQETLKITEAFYEEGLISMQDIHLVKADLSRAGESLQNARSARLSARRSLEILLGRYPAADLEGRRGFPALPGAVPVGIPSDMLERRPDIRAAERRVAAAFHRMKEARAAKLPSISLTGALGASSSQLTTLTDPINLLWNVAGSALFPIFNAGKLDADIDIRTAEQKAAIAQYQQVALNAFSEVETALDNEILFRTRQKHLEDAYENSKSAEVIADERYKAGEVELLDLLQIKRNTITIESNKIRSAREVLDQRVNLHLSLGANGEGL
ncbi:MAG: efflux transporter outer membrane subunit [Alphaproteobacteria bacterium]|nr:efflux transporter outer membrane subunit [Alphaproteobacteria bacterium]